MRLHQCAAIDCEEMVQIQYLMCRRHWRQVPSPLRKKLFGIWYQYQDGMVTLEQLQSVQAECVRAIAPVQEPSLFSEGGGS